MMFRTCLNLNTLLGISLGGLTTYWLYFFLKPAEDELYYSTVSNGSNNRIRQFRIPHYMITYIKGPKGIHLGSIKRQTNTLITFHIDETSVVESVICKIEGKSGKDCMDAENKILEYIESDVLCEAYKIFVPRNLIDKVVGNCKEYVKEISKMTKTEIRVSKHQQVEGTGCIMISGSRHQIYLAKSFVDKILDNVLASRLQIKAMLAHGKPMLPAKSYVIIDDYMNNPEVEKLHYQTGPYIDVHVLTLSNPSYIWLQLSGPKQTQLKLLIEEMTEYYSKEENRNANKWTKIRIGDLVATQSEIDNKWYRAKVLNYIPPDDNLKVKLQYVDLGGCCAAPIEEIYELNINFLFLNLQAIECYLAGVEPISNHWDSEARFWFEKWTGIDKRKKLRAKLNGCVLRDSSCIPGVDLFDVTDDEYIDLATQLVKHGFAVYKKPIQIEYINYFVPESFYLIEKILNLFEELNKSEHPAKKFLKVSY